MGHGAHAEPAASFLHSLSLQPPADRLPPPRLPAGLALEGLLRMMLTGSGRQKLCFFE